MHPLPSWLVYLAEAGRLAPSADNSQPWRFRFDGERFAVEFEPSRGSLGHTHPAVHLAFGALLENLTQAARAAEIDRSTWEYPDFAATGCLVQIPAPDRAPAQDRLPQAILARHTNRFPFARTPLPEDAVLALTDYREGGASAWVFCDRKAIARLARQVRLASQLRFQTEAIHRWLAGSLRFTEEEVARGEGLDVETLALPPGGKLLSRFLSRWERLAWLNRFGAYKLLARIEAAQFTQTGAAVAIVGEDPKAWLAAGRLMERVWLELTERGLAVQPYFVLPDQLWRWRAGEIPAHLQTPAQRLIQEAEAFFGEQTLFMLLRVGFPTRAAKRSKRLPLAALVVA
ncbi:hypothetical protein JCM13664_14220 [Methylothermus subterraneus]